MKKLNLIGLALLTAVVTLGSCTSQPQNPGTSDNGGSNQETTLNVDWEKFKNASTNVTIEFWSTMGSDLQEKFGRIIDAFEKEYPGIHVNHVTKGGYDTLFDNLKTAIAGGTQPTLAYCYSDHVATYLNSNMAVEDMTPYMFDANEGFGKDDIMVGDVENSTDFDDLISGYVEDGHNYSINGTKLTGYYSLPWVRSSETLIYNKTAFDEMGIDASKLATWEGVWEICAEIVKQKPDLFGSASVRGTQAPLGYDSADNMFITLSKQLGIPYTNGEYEVGGINYPLVFGLEGQGREKGEAMLRKLREYYYKGYFMNQDTAGGYTSSAFSNEKCFMTISSTAGVNYCVPTNGPNKNGFEIGVAPMPTSSDVDFVTGSATADGAKTNAVISQGPSICFFKRASDDQKAAAWLFYKFMSGSYYNAYFAGESGYEPVRDSSYNLDVFKAYSSYDTSLSTSDNLSERQSLAKGLVHNTVQNYNKEDRLFASDVFVGSAESRLAVGDLLNGVLTDTTSGNETISDDTLGNLYTNALRTAGAALSNK